MSEGETAPNYGLTPLWIWVSAWASATGWILSLFQQLNRSGYALAAFIGLTLGWLCFRTRRPSRKPGSRRVGQAWWAAWRRRIRRPLPALFLLLAVLVLMGGVIHPPRNHTGLKYRVPRVMHWLSEGHWHWIHTGDYRMNNRATGIEWLSTPVLLFAQSDRALFLLNYASFLLLPGLVYAVSSRLGVKRRVAWSWMWLLPSGYNFLLQGGSLSNDTFPTVYLLAAMYFAFRARETGRLYPAVLSVLSIALLTGAKASNLPLVLPWVVLAFPLVFIFKRWPVRSLVALLLAALVSFLPTALLNIVYCGDWSGLNLERTGMDMKNPVVGVWGNGLLLLLHNLLPPVIPFAGWWNAHILDLLPGFITQPLNANFEPGFHVIWELPHEDWSGWGFGVSWLLLLSLMALFFFRGRAAFRPGLRLDQKLVFAASWVALLAYCMKSGMVTPGRLISPYYALLVPSLLVFPGHEWLVRTRFWRWGAVLSMLIAAGVLVVTPPRPLLPLETIFGALAERSPGSRLFERGHNTYAVYSTRSDPMPALRSFFPAEERIVGFLADPDDMDISLWRPLGQRRVKHILLGDSAESMRERGIRYAVVSASYLEAEDVPFEEWVQKSNAEVLGSVTATIKVSFGPQVWHVVRLR